MGMFVGIPGTGVQWVTCKSFCVGMYLLAYPALGYVGMCKILYVGMCLLVCPALGYCECSS